MNSLRIGDKVESFNLENQHGNKVSLNEFKGKKILLSFHPLAWTSICTDQMRDLERNFEKFSDLGVVALGLSVDSAPSKSAWAKALSLDKLIILSDYNPFAEVTKNFGVYESKLNASGRANFLLDENLNLIWKKNYELSELPDLQEIFQILEK